MELNRKNMQKIALLILFTVLLLVGLQNIHSVIGVLTYVLHLAMPFVLGGAIAFILNVPMRWLESKLFPPVMQRKHPAVYRFRRVACLILTIVIMAGVVVILGFMVLPEIGRSAVTIGEHIRIFTQNVVDTLQDMAITYPDIVNQLLALAEDWQSIDWPQIGTSVIQFLQTGNFLGGTVSVASSIIGGVSNFLIGLVFAIYILLQKEKLSSQFKKICYSFLPEDKADGLLKIFQLSNDTFSSFISGQCLEAFILGLLFFIVMSLLRLPYAMAISMLIGVAALIPIFGAFIGCGVGAFLILIVNPMQAFIFVIVFLVLQQIEGNLIYPHVVGNSVGLPSIWVLVAVTLGASTMGVVGMIINIPLFSVIYALLRQVVYRRLKERRIPRSKLQ